MHKKDLLLLAEMPDGRGQIVGHQPEVALAERDAADRARHQIQQALEVLDAAHDPADAANRRKRRVVGVHRQLHIPLLGHWHDLLEEVFQVFP